MRTENDREKQAVCQLCFYSDKMRSLRMMYEESGSRKYLGPMAQCRKDMRKVVDKLSNKA